MNTPVTRVTIPSCKDASEYAEFIKRAGTKTAVDNISSSLPLFDIDGDTKISASEFQEFNATLLKYLKKHAIQGDTFETLEFGGLPKMANDDAGLIREKAAAIAEVTSNRCTSSSTFDLGECTRAALKDAAMDRAAELWGGK